MEHINRTMDIMYTLLIVYFLLKCVNEAHPKE